MKYPALKASILLCMSKGINLSDDILMYLQDIGLGELKALQDYDNAISRLAAIRIQQLRQATVPPGNFGEELAKVVESGLNEAWRLGMRENDVTDMLPEWRDLLDGIIADEKSHIPDLSQYLADTAPAAETTGEAMTQIQGRISMWVNRYEDVRNMAILASADEKTKLEWIYGDTQHCTTCSQLNGIVAYAREWDEAGVHPQGPPNDLIECGGWHCACQLAPTDKRRSANALDKITAIALG